MIKSIVLAPLFALCAIAGPVTISDTLKLPNGQLYNGRIIVSIDAKISQPLYTSAGDTLTGWEKSIAVTDGVFSLTLEANDTITPTGTYYRAQWIPSDGTKPWVELWRVPTSATPLKVSLLRTGTPPASPVMISPAQIASGGAISGQGLVWSGSSWIPAPIGAALTATAVIDVAAVPDGSCVLDSTAVTVTGAALGGRPSIGASVAWPEGVKIEAKVTGPNSVKLEICNHSGAAYDPAPATFYFGVTQ